MKIQSLIILFLILYYSSASQQQSFDIINFSPIAGWKKEINNNAIHFSKENKSDGSYCFVTVFKSAPATGTVNQNFDVTWKALAKDLVIIANEPEIQPATSDDGWETVSGHAAFENQGKKGVIMLITSSGYEKMVNILVLTNTGIYEQELSDFLNSISLTKPSETNDTATKENNSIHAGTHSGNSAFHFNSTNFDDGWVSEIKDNWVEVTKKGIRVLIHYPNQKTDIHHFNKLEGDNNAWNLLVAPRYSNLTNFYERGIQDYQSITFFTANATEKQSGKKVYVVFFKKHYDKGNGRYIEVIADNQDLFEKEFGNNYINRSSWDYLEQIKSWDKLANMQWRNKFAIAPSDLMGKWSSSTYASLSYYYVNSGSFAGATATSIADEFTFLPGNKYESDHAGASGVVGNQKFSRQVYKGNSVISNWSITLTNRFQGATEKYDCYFEAIKGGRILLMTDRLGYTLSLVKSKS